MDLQAALQAFLLQIEADGRSPHTARQYQRHVRALIDWLAATGAATTVADLTPDLLARFFADGAARNSVRGGTKRATSLNAMRTSIRCFAAHLHQSGLIATNPARLLRRARCAPPPPRALHADEQQRLLAVLAAGTGPEAEGDRPTTAILPATVAEKLKAFLAGRKAGPVFLAGDRRISMRHAQRRLAGWLMAAKITGRSAHGLRHTFATRIYQQTGDLHVTQAALGHASIASTCIYAKIDKARVRAAVGA